MKTIASGMLGRWTVDALGGAETIEGTMHDALVRANEVDGAAVVIGETTIATGDDVEAWGEACGLSDDLRAGVEMDIRYAALAAGWLG